MTVKTTDDSNYQNIANAIRNKNGLQNTYYPHQMANAINDILNYFASDEGKVISSGNLVSQTSLNINTNGTYDTTEKNSAIVSVPNSYSASDEGKVVSSGELISQTNLSINTNGTYNTTDKNSVDVSVPNSYSAEDEGKVVSSGELVSQTSLSVHANGTYDTTRNSSVVVSVPVASGAGIKAYVYSDVPKRAVPQINVTVNAHLNATS